MEKVSLASQLRKDFKRDDQQLTDFMAEMKLLTPEDKADFTRKRNETCRMSESRN